MSIEAFEVWWNKTRGDIEYQETHYEAWQASRKAALLEAAEVCTKEMAWTITTELRRMAEEH